MDSNAAEMQDIEKIIDSYLSGKIDTYFKVFAEEFSRKYQVSQVVRESKS